eukprot:scaffold297159_cov33-Tisochrysis_lutea.AAC.2
MTIMWQISWVMEDGDGGRSGQRAGNGTARQCTFRHEKSGGFLASATPRSRVDVVIAYDEVRLCTQRYAHRNVQYSIPYS